MLLVEDLAAWPGSLAVRPSRHFLRYYRV